MSGFGMLFYTDCVPGQGLQGTAGFQFQATSPGLASAMMGPVQRATLHEAPIAWMREQRPVETYPRSLAHVTTGDAYVTAAGVYLGREANGNREGNQFTHAVVTRDREDYGSLRPAQLWAAPWWVEKPVAGTELPEMASHPEPGPLDVDTVHERIRAAQGGREQLVALVSALHHLSDPERRRTVVLVTEDPERAACWLAAATLLLPAPAALRIGFKIFVADPQRGGHDVIALHPEWAGRWASTERGTGLAVFDLDALAHSEIEPTDDASFWVPRFLDEDPYDIADAVELAGLFTGGSMHSSATDRVVALVVAASRPLGGDGEIRAVAEWLRDARPEALAVVRDPVLEVVLEGNPSGDVLRTLVAAAARPGWEEHVGTLRARLLDAELAEVRRGPADAVGALNVVRALPALTGAAVPASGTDAVISALRTAPDERIPALCVLADRHGIGPGYARLGRDVLDRFCRWWVQRPEPELRIDRWPAPPESIDVVTAILQEWVTGRPEEHARAIAAIQDRWFAVLWDSEADFADPLNQALASQACWAPDGPDRDEVLSAVLDSAVRQGGDAAARAWQTMFPAPPGIEDVGWFLECLGRHPLPIGTTVGARAGKAVDRVGDLSPAVLGVVERMRELDIALPAHGRRIEEKRVLVRRIEQALVAGKKRYGAKEMARDLAGIPIEIVDVHGVTLARALADAPSDLAIGLVTRSDRDRMKKVYTALEEEFRAPGALTEHAVRAAAFTFLLTGAHAGNKEQRQDFRTLRGRLAEAMGERSRPELARIEKSHSLGEGWATWVRQQTPSRLQTLFRAVRPAKKNEG